jgi:hypothetical protein
VDGLAAEREKNITSSRLIRNIGPLADRAPRDPCTRALNMRDKVAARHCDGSSTAITLRLKGRGRLCIRHCCSPTM